MRLIGWFLIFLIVGVSSVSSVGGKESDVSLVTFYFHGNILMLRSENRSIFVFDRADVDSPVRDEATVVEFSSEIKQVVMGVTVWVGGVSWGSRRLLNDTRMVGTASFHCWLSSEDWLWFWELSGVGVGVAEVDGKGRVVWGPVYRYTYALMNMLSSSPKEYSLTVDVDHMFKAGNHILFGVVAGSTRQGWRARAYFGSAGFPSRVVVPLLRS